MADGGGEAPSPKRGEVEKLSKENFNLKLRIYHYEETLRKLRRGGAETDEELHKEIMEQKVLIDEKDGEIKDLKVLMVKARTKIETLLTDLQICQTQLEEQRVSQLAVDELRAKEAELEAMSSRVNSLERRDHDRVQEMLALGQELRDANQTLSQRQALNSENAAALKRAEQRVKDLEEDAKQASTEAKLQERKMDELSAQVDALQQELLKSRATGVESATALSRQRAREAELVDSGKKQAAALGERVQQLENSLEETKRERDKSLHACAVAERKAEDLEEKLKTERDESARLSASLLALTQNLAESERESNERIESLRRDLALDKEKSVKEGYNEITQLRGQLAQTQGRLKAINFAKDEVTSAVMKEQQRCAELHDRISQIKEEHKRREGESEEALKRLRDELDEAKSRIAQEAERREKAEGEQRLQIKKATEREKGLREEIRAWEHKLQGKLDVIIPASTGTAEDFSSLSWSFENDDGPGKENQESTQRPKPRRMDRGPGPSQIENSLEKLKQLKSTFVGRVRDVEDKWHVRVQDLVRRLEKSESRVAIVQNKFDMYTSSMQQITKQRQVHVTGQRNGLEEQVTDLKSNVAESRDVIRRLRDDKDQLRDQIVDLREERARGEGVKQQLRSDLESSQKERLRLETRLGEVQTAKGVLEENNRLLALELEDRTKKYEKLNRNYRRIERKHETVCGVVETQKATIFHLQNSLKETQRTAKERGRSLSRTRAKLDRSLSGDFDQQPILSPLQSPRGRGVTTAEDAENEIRRQIEDTDRAIRDSASLNDRHKQHRESRRDNESALGASVREQCVTLERQTERFSDVLVAAVDLVERTKAMLSRRDMETHAGDTAQELTTINHRLSQDLLSLGKDLHALHQRFLASMQSYAPVSAQAFQGTPVRRNSHFEPDSGGSNSYWRQKHGHNSGFVSPARSATNSLAAFSGRRGSHDGRTFTELAGYTSSPNSYNSVLGRLERIKMELSRVHMSGLTEGTKLDFDNAH